MVRFRLNLCLFALGWASMAAAQNLTPVSMEAFFFDPGKPATLAFNASNVAEEALDFTLSDYRGNPCGQGKLQRENGQARFTATVKLGRGFYDLSVPATKQRFGLVCGEAFIGERDPFFCMETLLKGAWAMRGGALRVVRRCGIDCAREWEAWQDDEKIRGKPDLSRETIYGDFAREGIKSVCCFSTAPAWTGAAAGTRDYPRDLLSVEASILSMVERRSPSLAAFQVWNEPEHIEHPGDTLLPFTAACSWFFKEHGVTIPLAGAPFSSGDLSAACLGPYFKNGFAQTIDVFTFHTYSHPDELLGLVKAYRSWLKGSPKAGMPIWITESGKPWSRKLARLTSVYGGTRGSLRADVEEDRTSALWITMKAVEAKAAGIERYFPFTLRFFEENNNNFGLLDYYGTPMRSMAAYARAIVELAGLGYLGDLKPLPAGACSARVFSDGKRATAILYTGASGLTPVRLGDLPVRQARAMDGSPARMDPDTGLAVDGGMAYLELDPGKLAGRVNGDTEAMALKKLSASYRPTQRAAFPLLFQFPYWEIKDQDRNHYRAEPQRIEVNAFNLSAQERSLRPELVLPEGGRITATAFPEGLVAIPAKSSKRLRWEVDLSACRELEMVIAVREPSGLAPTLSLPFLAVEKGRGVRFPVSDPSRWRANSSGELRFTAEEDGACLRVHADFSNAKKDFWVYPEFALRLPEEGLSNAVGLSYEVKAVQGMGSTFYAHSLVMLVYGDSGEKARYDGFKVEPPRPEWQKRLVTFPTEKAAQATALRIGMGSADPILDYWIRNLKVYYAR